MAPYCTHFPPLRDNVQRSVPECSIANFIIPCLLLSQLFASSVFCFNLFYFLFEHFMSFICMYYSSIANEICPILSRAIARGRPTPVFLLPCVLGISSRRSISTIVPCLCKSEPYFIKQVLNKKYLLTSPEYI